MRHVASATMIDVLVNGTPSRVELSTTVADVVASWCVTADGVAVARNREVVPRSEWALTELADHDRIEILTAVAGG